MTKKMEFEFLCPQFVDFCSGVEGLSSDDGSFSFPDKRSELFLKSKLQKPNPRILSSTPFNKKYFVNMNCRSTSNKTDSEKINRITKKIKRQSKSFDSLLRLPEDKEHEFVLRKSISATDVRLKKLTRPITPECLKRSSKKIFMSTEELELEKIAQLQKQTYNHLRANEIAMRRLKMKQIRKDSLKEEIEEKSSAKIPPKGYGFMERIGVYARNVCSLLPREIVKGQYPVFNSGLKRIPSIKVSRFIESRCNLPAPSNANLISVKNETGAFLKSSDISHSGTNKNMESIQTVKCLLPPVKSRRCLFQKNGQTPF